MVKVEICINCDSSQSVSESVGAAFLGGASTVELCANMKEDGFTPTKTQIIEARKAFENRNGLMVMIRNRSGDFSYSEKEIIEMGEQIKMASGAGADGVVFGVLNKENNVDVNSLQYLLKIANKHKLEVTFHRAFDATPNQLEALEILEKFGVNRILTSGTKWNQNKTALDGINDLAQIIKISKNNIEIVIGGGVNINNVCKILNNIYLTDKIISVHSYSGVQINGHTKLDLVKMLVEKTKIF
jgi:copper homeostasis protein